MPGQNGSFLIRGFLILVFGLIATMSTVQATPNVVGTFNGNMTGQLTPGPTATSQSVSITITKQDGNNLYGKISLSPAGLSTTFTGTISDAGFIDVQPFDTSATVETGGGFAGTFNGSTLTINGVGGMGSLIIFFPSGCSTCNQYELGGTLAFSGSIIDPETAPSTTLKDAGTIQSEITSITNPIQGHLRTTLHGQAKGGKINQNGFLIEGEGGLNAGDLQFGNVGLWLSYNYTATENDFVRTAFESDRHNVIGGVDVSPSDTYVFGLAFGYETGETDTTFNLGNLETDGVTLVPYLGILLSDHWSLDASFGYSWVDNDQYRTAPGTTTRITSDPDANRYFYTANLNGITFIDNWVIGGRFGFLFAKNETEGFTESDGTPVAERETTLGQFRVGGDVAYSFQEFEPFVSLLYERDYMFEKITLTPGAQPANDRDDLLFSAGLRYFGQQGLSANLEYAKRFLREDFDEDSFTATLRYDF